MDYENFTVTTMMETGSDGRFRARVWFGDESVTGEWCDTKGAAAADAQARFRREQVIGNHKLWEGKGYANQRTDRHSEIHARRQNTARL